MLCKNRAYLSVLTDRFNVSDIIGRTVIIHNMPDDFTSQPSGNAGEKIACGVIKKF
jgi:Cu-Zn family superoxide dismutase